MPNYTKENHLGSLQVVSDSSADPINMFQPPSFYQQTPYILQTHSHFVPQYSLQNHGYNQHFSPYQQYNFKSESILSSTSTKHVSSGAVFGSVKFDPWQLQQLSEIRILVKHAMTQIENLQLSLSKCSNQLNQIQCSMKPNLKKAHKTEINPTEKMLQTVTTSKPKAKISTKAKKPSEVVAPAKAPANKAVVKEVTSVMKTLAKQVAPVKKVVVKVESIEFYKTHIFKRLEQVFFDIVIRYLKFEFIDYVDTVLGKDAYRVSVIMFERNKMKVVKNITFIFDPGGSGYLKVNASLQPQFDSSSFSLLDQYDQYLKEQHISTTIWYIQGSVIQEPINYAVGGEYRLPETKTRVAPNIKANPQASNRLNAAIKADLQKVQIIKELNQEFDYVNPSFSKINLQCKHMSTRSHKKEELRKQFNDATDFAPCDYDVCSKDQLFLAPPPLDREWISKSVVYALVDLTTVMLGHPKDGTTEVDLQHPAIWMVGLYRIQQFLNPFSKLHFKEGLSAQHNMKLVYILLHIALAIQLGGLLAEAYIQEYFTAKYGQFTMLMLPALLEAISSAAKATHVLLGTNTMHEQRVHASLYHSYITPQYFVQTMINIFSTSDLGDKVVFKGGRVVTYQIPIFTT